MSVEVGGIYAGRHAAVLANSVCAELREVNGATNIDDWTVDLCLRTYVVDGVMTDEVAGTGIRPMNWSPRTRLPVRVGRS